MVVHGGAWKHRTDGGPPRRANMHAHLRATAHCSDDYFLRQPRSTVLSRRLARAEADKSAPRRHAEREPARRPLAACAMATCGQQMEHSCDLSLLIAKKWQRPASRCVSTYTQPAARKQDQTFAHGASHTRADVSGGHALFASTRRPLMSSGLPGQTCKLATASCREICTFVV